MAEPYNVQNDGDGALEALVAAGLISTFRQSTLGTVYEKAVKCFDVLMNIVEDPDTARRISTIVNKSVTLVRNSAQTIIDLLLFNSGNDPYMSLCLPRYAPEEEVSRRWKRLIVFYHPDRYSGQHREHEERAKRINEAFEEIQRTGKGFHVDEALRSIIKRNADYASLKNEITSHTPKRKASFYRYLRRLPVFILISSFFITVFSILLLIYAG